MRLGFYTLTALVAFVMTADDARANPWLWKGPAAAGPVVPAPAGDIPPQEIPLDAGVGGGYGVPGNIYSAYGWNPIFLKWRMRKAGLRGPVPVAPAGPAQGTLVFPNHPFARSPRDFFMMEP